MICFRIFNVFWIVNYFCVVVKLRFEVFRENLNWFLFVNLIKIFFNWFDVSLNLEMFYGSVKINKFNLENLDWSFFLFFVEM